MKIYFYFTGEEDYGFSRKKPEKKEGLEIYEIEIKKELIPRAYSFTGDSNHNYGVITANTDINSILNIVSAIKQFRSYHFNMIEEALKIAGIDVGEPGIEDIDF